jgi:hypothetical protein
MEERLMMNETLLHLANATLTNITGLHESPPKEEHISID